MAFVWSKDSVFKVDDSGGTLRTLTTYMTSCDGLPGEFDELDTTAFGDSAHRVIAGLENGSFTVGVMWDGTATTGPDATLAGARGKVGSFEWGPGGGTPAPTTPVYRGEALCKSYKTVGNVGTLVLATAEFKVDGVVTRAVA